MAKRRRFTAEFKQQIVRVVVDEGQQILAVANDRGLSQSLVYQWIRQARIERGEGPRKRSPALEKQKLPV